MEGNAEEKLAAVAVANEALEEAATGLADEEETKQPLLTDEEQFEKPPQPGLTTEEWLASPAVKCLLGRDATTWTAKEKNQLAKFLSNRDPMLGSLKYGSPAARAYNDMATEVEKITDKDFVLLADPILMSVRFTGAGEMPAAYLDVLQAINVFNGGLAGNTGHAGQPIAFVNGYNTLLHVANRNVFEQLFGALVTSDQLGNNVDIVRLSTTLISAQLNPSKESHCSDSVIVTPVC